LQPSLERQMPRPPRPVWRVIGLGQMVLSALVFVSWVAITSVFYTGGVARDWMAGGWGLVTLVYSLTLGFSGWRLAFRHPPAWLGWVEATAVVPLLVVAFLSCSAILSGGAILFFAVVGIGALILGGVAAWAAATLLRRSADL
jgi:hypothetical protein